MKLIYSLIAYISLTLAASAQGYINPPIYAPGIIFAPAGTTINTIINPSFNHPTDLSVVANGNITTWNITLPNPGYDGQTVYIGCGAGSASSISVTATSPVTIASGGFTSCIANSGNVNAYQFSAVRNTWLLLNNSTVAASVPVSGITGLGSGVATALTAATGVAGGLVLGPVSLSNIEPIPNNTAVGNVSGGSAAPAALSPAQVVTLVQTPFYNSGVEGVTGNRTTNDAPALQSLIDTACTQGDASQIVTPTPFNALLTSTLSFSQCTGLQFNGGGGTGGDTYYRGPSFVWGGGSSTGAVLSVDQAADSVFSHFNVSTQNGSGQPFADVGIDVGQTGTVTQTNTHDSFDNFSVFGPNQANTSFVGVRIGYGSSANTDIGTYDHGTIVCGNQAGDGVQVTGSAQPFATRFSAMQVDGCDYGYTIGGDLNEFLIDGQTAENNITDLYVDGGENVTYENVRSEGATTAVVQTNNSEDLNILSDQISGYTGTAPLMILNGNGNSRTVVWDLTVDNASGVTVFGNPGSAGGSAQLLIGDSEFPTGDCPDPTQFNGRTVSFMNRQVGAAECPNMSGLPASEATGWESIALGATSAEDSPILTLGGWYLSASSPAAVAKDLWTLEDVVGTGLDGASVLTFAHSGTSGAAMIAFPSISVSGQVDFAGLSGGTIAGALCQDSSGHVVPSTPGSNCYGGASGGNVSAVGTPANGQVAVWTSSSTIEGLTTLPSGLTLPSPTITGALTATGLVTDADLAATTGSGSVALATSPTFVTPALGTPASGVATNLTGTASGLTAGNVTTNANLTGDVTSSGNATTLATVNSNTGAIGSSTAIPVITLNGKGLATSATTAAVIAPAGTLTGTALAGGVTSAPGLLSAAGGAFASGAFASAYSLPTATASVLGGVKPDGTTISNSSGAISVTYGTASNTAAQGNDSRITGALSASAVTLPSSFLASSLTGVGALASGSLASGFTPVTNALLANSTISGISLGSNLDTLTFGTHLASGGSSYNGSAAVTITSDATAADTVSTLVARDSSGNFSAGTITASLTGHASLDCALAGCTMSGALAMGGQAISGGGAITGTTLTSTISSGTAPLTVSSTTNVANLNASSLNGATFAAPGSIGSGTAAAGTFTTLAASTSLTDSALGTAGVTCNSSAGLLSTTTGNCTGDTPVVAGSALTGTSLASSVVSSSLTSVGTLTGGATGAGFTIALGTSTITGDLALASGGTASNLTASNGGLVYSTGVGLAILSGTATAGQCALSGSNSAPTWGSCGGGGGGLTLNSTTVSGGSADNLLYTDGTKLQGLALGTGVFTALGDALNGTGGLVGFSGNIGAAAGTTLALGGCSLGAAGLCVDAGVQVGAGSPTTGIAADGSGLAGYASGNQTWISYSGAQIGVGSGGVYTWNSTTTPGGGAEDTMLSRVSAGVVGVGSAGGPVAGSVQVGGLLLDNIVASATAPTIASGFGTTPSVAHNNGTTAFTINVGTGGSASSGVVGLPTAANGWNCYATDITTHSTSVSQTKQTAESSTSATLTNYSDVAVATAWAANDILAVSCFAY